MFQKISLIIFLIFVSANLMFAKQSALAGKRFVSVSYGLGNHENLDNSVYITRLTMNIPLSRHLDLSVGSFQGWSEQNSEGVSTEYREYTFFSKLKYHFIPNSVINPFLTIEMGQEATQMTTDSTQTDLTSSSLMLGGEQSYATSYNDFNFYYCASIGEEFLINDKSAFGIEYKYGSISNENLQYLTTNIGYWILEQFYIDVHAQFHFNTEITSYHLVGNISF